jgi:hypothetical protein
MHPASLGTTLVLPHTPKTARRLLAAITHQKQIARMPLASDLANRAFEFAK